MGVIYKVNHNMMKFNHRWLFLLLVVILFNLLLYLYRHTTTSLTSPPQAIPAGKLQLSNPVQQSTHSHSAVPPTREVHGARVVIVAHSRSGSSFLGGIFNAHPDVFYLYEPLVALENIMNVKSNDYLHRAKNVINSVVNCRFSDGPYLQKLSVLKFHRASSKVLVSPPFCSISDTAFNFLDELCGAITAHALNDVCRNSTHVVTKVLLYRLQPADISWALHVARADVAPVRIVFLVRDPRAMLFSRFKLGWMVPKARMSHSLESGEAEGIVEETCHITIRNLVEVARKPHRIELVRYEDLATNPEEVAAHLFKVLGISTSEYVTSWIQNKSRGEFDANAFSLSRPGRIVVNSWRKNIPLKLLTMVEDKCRKVMDYMGYIRINGSMELLRDGNKSLFSDHIRDLKMLLREVVGGDERFQNAELTNA